MTHCKIGVNLGCTRCEKSSFINVFHITTTYSFSFFITISEKINAKSQKNRIFLIIFDSYPIKILKIDENAFNLYNHYFVKCNKIFFINRNEMYQFFTFFV